jgi:hypothetical protein
VYVIVLQAHSLLHWIVLLMLAIACVRGLRGWAANMPYGRTDRVTSLSSVLAIDTQLLLGLVLHLFLSPLTAAGLRNVGAANRPMVPVLPTAPAG